jgi:uncharacterized Zn-binding protein involved in type VI secretion
MFPAARLTDLTATGDVITAPGAPVVLICGMPAACVGDSVNGTVCVGAIVTGAFTVLVGARPAARVTSSVAGVNPIIGIPVSTIVIPPCSITVLMGG